MGWSSAGPCWAPAARLLGLTIRFEYHLFNRTRAPPPDKAALHALLAVTAARGTGLPRLPRALWLLGGKLACVPGRHVL